MSTISEEYKLSLPTAILININIMLGAGIFINTQQLAQTAGVLGAFNYLIVGALMLPLILCIAELLKLHPAGGFYTYARAEISPFIGFLSGWSYFTSKLASSMLMIHVSMSLLQQIFSPLSNINIFYLDSIVVCFFVALNMLNIKAGSNIQKLFIGFKTIPIFFAILVGFFLLQGANFSSANMIWSGIPISLPWVIYAVIGFEAACSVSSKIKDAERNAPLAVLISFAIVLVIAFLYQLLFYGALGTRLSSVNGVIGIFPALLAQLMPGNEILASKLEGFLHLAIASSTLGAAYGILFSNCWNLHILAKNGHILFSSFFAKLNAQLVPFACVLVEGALCFLYLWISGGCNVPLQQIGALGCVISYAFSVWALLNAMKTKNNIRLSKNVAYLGIASCSILMAACINSFFTKGMSSLIIYASLIILGVIMYMVTQVRKK